ncbi:glycoside hydrolase [Roridomyces roridus]|uniref:Glycoside hydrolase n=1 Tax=Roridomyces roridus TaxID=1738132 RepID=A0AAD7CAZ2_9AGAR|nr:glycoside hydrolase [Roridomyces roridus]
MMHLSTVLLLALSTRAAVIPSRRSLNQRQASPKLVVAHHIVGNTFTYTPQDWTDDMNLASASGIDGFALNIGPDDFQVTQTQNAFQAADALGGNFKLFFSLDMSVLPCATADDGAALRQRVLDFATRPSHLQVNGKAFVSTFAGESCTFGEASVPDGWRNQFTQHPDLQGKIQFVPSFFIDPATFTDFSGVMDGAFNFNSGWPIQVTVDFADGIANDLAGTGDSLTNTLNQFIGANATDLQQIGDLANLAAGGSRLTYMAAVAPHFFTHFGADSFNKNFIFLADQHLLVQRWETLIALRDQVDIVEIVTWNDYGESHYVGPIKGVLPPGSEPWVNGFPHQDWLDLTRYFATAFKTGTTPTIDKDQIIMWARPHPALASSPDPLSPPTTFQITQDNIWAVVMATAAGTATLTDGISPPQTFDVVPGVNKLAIPIAPGGTLSGTLERNGQTVVSLQTPGSDFTFNGAPALFNYNVFVASATSA